MAEIGIVRPGDKLVARLRQHISREEAEQLEAGLREYLPGVELIFVAGVEQLLLVRDESIESTAAGGVDG